MKVKDLILALQDCDLEAEIRVLFPLDNRPVGGHLEPIFNIIFSTDQDTNQRHYVIDTGIGEKKRYEAFYIKKDE